MRAITIETGPWQGLRVVTDAATDAELITEASSLASSMYHRGQTVGCDLTTGWHYRCYVDGECLNEWIL